MPFLDPRLIGWWEFQSVEMPSKTLKLIGGLDGKVCFADSGHYRTPPDYDDVQRYHCADREPYSELDIWIRGHEKFPSLCLYEIDENVLKIAVVGQPLGVDYQSTKRPFAMRKDEELNWALVTMKRTEPPMRRVTSGSKRTVRKQSGTARLIATTTQTMSLSDYLSKKSNAAKGKTKDWLAFCTLDVTTGTLWAGDPHVANADDGCVVEVPPGKYVVEAIGMTFNRHRVVSKLRVRLENVENPIVAEKVGDTGTDSAIIGICDIKAFDAACGPDSGEEVQESIESQTGNGFGIITIEKFPGTVMAFVPTGSDGNGPVFALVSNGKCVGIELLFMEEEDMDSSSIFDHVVEKEMPGGDPLTDIVVHRIKVYGAEADNLIRKIGDLCCRSELEEWWEREIGRSEDRALALRKARARYEELVKRARENGWEI